MIRNTPMKASFELVALYPDRFTHSHVATKIIERRDETNRGFGNPTRSTPSANTSNAAVIILYISISNTLHDQMTHSCKLITFNVEIQNLNFHQFFFFNFEYFIYLIDMIVGGFLNNLTNSSFIIFTYIFISNQFFSS